MSKSSYLESDDKPVVDDTDAPSSEVDLHKRCRTGSGERIPLMSDTRPPRDPVKLGMDYTDEQIRRDEDDTMDWSNVMKGEAHEAKPPQSSPSQQDY